MTAFRHPQPFRIDFNRLQKYSKVPAEVHGRLGSVAPSLLQDGHPQPPLIYLNRLPSPASSACIVALSNKLDLFAVHATLIFTSLNRALTPAPVHAMTRGLLDNARLVKVKFQPDFTITCIVLL